MADRKQWYVLKVRPTFESIAIRELRKRDFEAFLPENNSKLAHRANAYELLVPETVFCQFDLNDRDRVLSAPGVMCILGIPNPTPVDDGKISALRTAISSDASRTTLLSGKPHNSVRVMTGPLQGVTGDLFEIDGRKQLGIRVKLIERTLAFDIQGCATRTLRQTVSSKTASKPLGYRRRSPISRDN